MRFDKLESELLQYLVTTGVPAGERVPTLTELSEVLGISVGKLREQLEVARHLNIVSVRPRKGIRREPFDFRPALLTSLLFGLATDEATFRQFSQLRQAVETGFWLEAVAQLTPADIENLRELLSRAAAKLRGNPPHIPNQEHRQFHLSLFARLDNPFVQGLLEAYWMLTKQWKSPPLPATNIGWMSGIITSKLSTPLPLVTCSRGRSCWWPISPCCVKFPALARMGPIDDGFES